MSWSVIKGDMRDVLPLFQSESVDSIVCDPPYGLSKEPDVVEVLEHWLVGDDYVHKTGGFMGKSWDSFVPGPSYWRACYDALKPGGYLIAFGGTRTYDLMVIAVRLAGFEVRDQLQWLYGQGFPKSLDVSKAIDRQLGQPQAVAGRGDAVDRGALDYGGATGKAKNGLKAEWEHGDPNTPEAEQWRGWGTALKPAHEPIVLARKPFKGTVASNVLVHGTGVINVDGCRIEGKAGSRGGGYPFMGSDATFAQDATTRTMVKTPYETPDAGRWPANVMLDEDAAALLDAQSGELVSGANPTRRGSDKFRGVYSDLAGQPEAAARGVDRGGASRFFYCAKASAAERNAGLEHLPAAADKRTTTATSTIHNGRSGSERVDDHEYIPRERANTHPTVKPIELMRWLQRLVTPPGGLIVDPFAGSGSSGCAAALEGFDFIGIELDADDEGMVETATARITYWESTKTGGD